MEFVDERDLYRAFFKDDAKYYLDKYDSVEKGSKVLFNPYAFFLSYLWMAYRKMYAELAIFITSSTIVTLAIETTIENSKGLNIIEATLAGMLANYCYIQKAKRMVAKTENMSDNEKLDFLQKKGGTSWISVIAVLVLSVSLYFLGEYIEEIASRV